MERGPNQRRGVSNPALTLACLLMDPKTQRGDYERENNMLLVLCFPTMTKLHFTAMRRFRGLTWLLCLRP
jgi:Ca2+/Na+ antiporter